MPVETEFDTTIDTELSCIEVVTIDTELSCIKVVTVVTTGLLEGDMATLVSNNL